GVQFINFGAQTSTPVSTAIANLRTVTIADGQLYVSTASGTAVRIGSVGSGTPITASQPINNLPGVSTSGSPNAFAFVDLSPSVPGVDTLYIADDSANQIQKYSIVAGAWVATGSATASTVRGVT